MKEIMIKNKQQYLKDNYPFDEVPNLADKKHCIHCDKDIVAGEFKVFLKDGDELIYCPNAPKCNGNVIDWMEIENYLSNNSRL